MGYLYNAEKNCFVKAEKGQKNIPQLMWHITGRCNLRCRFCFSKKTADDLDIGKLDAYIQRFQKFHVQKIDISGGEPLQYLYLKKVCTGLYENNIYMTLTTRGVGSEDNLQWLLENGHMFSRIIISLDAGERELQQLLAGSQEVERTMPLIEELSKRYPDILRINTVVTKYLLQKEHIEKLVRIICESGCKEWCLIEPHPANKRNTFDNVAVSKEEFRMVCETIRKDYIDREKISIIERFASDYVGYWVLNSDGILAKHSEGETDIFLTDFLSAPVKSIMDMVCSDIQVPEEENT